MMKKQSQTLEIRLLPTEIDCSHLPMVRRARLVQITGKGALRFERTSLPDYRFGQTLTLNGVPLISADLPISPTTAGLLSTGYGIENADSPELMAVSDAVNGDFVSLERSIEVMSPLLGLLETGLYVIADCDCYPTDGDGHFFWAQSNELRVNPATGMVFSYDPYYLAEGQPIYLYPGQSATRYDPDRVDYYRNRLSQIALDENHAPRAIAFHIEQFMNCLLDGHHKAAAACLNGTTVPTLVIIPVDGYEYIKSNHIAALHMGTFRLDVQEIQNEKGMADFLKACEKSFRKCKKRVFRTRSHKLGKICTEGIFEPEYARAAKQFPTVYEYADMVASGITLSDCQDDEAIESWLAYPIEENQQKLKTVLFFMEDHCDDRLKKLAMEIARTVPNGSLKVQSYRCLSNFENDSEIEQFFIDYLVNCDDPHDAVRPIVDGYWDRKRMP